LAVGAQREPGGENGRAMTTATVAVEVERFQLIPMGDGPSLLRIAARWRADESVDVDSPVLVIDDGSVQRIFEALPGPRAAPPTASPERPRWQAGFSVPPELLEGQVAFALDAGAVGIIGLPAPVEGQSGGVAVPAVTDDRVAELERQVAAERHARRETEFEAATHAEAEIAAQSVAAERADHLAGLERELADAREALAAAQVEVQEAQRERRAAEERAARAEAQIGELAETRRAAEMHAAAAREARQAAEARAADAERALDSERS
jgi:hypothetical protein